MDYSHAEPAERPCRACGRPFAAEVWVILDVAERPDLLARLRAGKLHTFTCPHCGHAATINAPLLILQPGQTPALLFSPGRGGDRENDEAQAAALIGLLRTHMGAEWRAEWLEAGVVGVAREALPVALGAGAAALAAVAAAPEADVPPAVRAALEEVLSALAAEGVRVQSAADLQRALAARPALAARVAAALGASG